MDMLENIFGSKSRAEVFRHLFERNGVEIYLRELQRRAGLSIGPIQQEIAKLLAAGLLLARRDGNRLYYRANSKHPLFPEIRGLVEKTSGVQVLLKNALADPQIQFVFIFGSVAKGKEQPDSDLDLFVVGDLGLRKLTKLLTGLSEKIGREINPHVMTAKEWNEKIKSQNHFIASVMNSDKVFVFGDEDEFKRLGKKRVS